MRLGFGLRERGSLDRRRAALCAHPSASRECIAAALPRAQPARGGEDVWTGLHGGRAPEGLSRNKSGAATMSVGGGNGHPDRAERTSRRVCYPAPRLAAAVPRSCGSRCVGIDAAPLTAQIFVEPTAIARARELARSAALGV